MKRCLIRITRADGQSFHYSGLFASTFDAVIDGLRLTVGQKVRISAKVLP